MRYVFVDLAILIGTRTEPLDGGNDHARVDGVDLLPGKTHAVEHAGAEILHQNITFLDKAGENLLAGRIFCVKRDRALVVIEHGEIEAVDLGNILQLTARDVANPRTLDLDDVSAEPGEKLRTCRA